MFIRITFKKLGDTSEMKGKERGERNERKKEGKEKTERTERKKEKNRRKERTEGRKKPRRRFRDSRASQRNSTRQLHSVPWQQPRHWSPARFEMTNGRAGSG